MDDPKTFSVPNISIAGAPDIVWTFTHDVGHAELFGATAHTEMRDDVCYDLQIKTSSDEIIADVMVGCALLWSHARYLEAHVR